MTISGMVIDHVSKTPLPGVVVSLLVFEPGRTLFSLGSYQLKTQIETDMTGKFEFVVEEGASIDIRTRSVDSQLYGGARTVSKIRSNVFDIVIEHSQTGPPVLYYPPADAKNP